MHYYFVILGIVAGLCLGFGILYLFIGLRRKENKRLNLTFSLFALCYAGTLLDAIGWYSATSVTEFVSASRWDAVFVVTAFVALIWYVAFYTGVRPRIFLWGLTIAFVAPGIAQIVRPNMIHQEILGLTYITLPWGERLASLEATDSFWSFLFLFARLVTLGFILFACFRQYRRGERQAAIVLGAGMLWFVATIVFEILGESGVVAYFPLGEFGFLAIALVMSLQMANSVIRTEEELGRYRLSLEALVEARTAELTTANQHLVNEIAARERAEAALRESESRARALMNAPPDSALLIDPKGIILDVNQIGAERLGTSVAEAPGRCIYDLFEPVPGELRRAKIAEVLAIGQPARWEDERGGRHFDNSLYPILDPGGRVISIAVFASDITERVHAEEALRQRVEELAVLNRIAHTLATAAELPEALGAVSQMVTSLFGASYAHIILPGEEDDELMVLFGFERQTGPLERTRVDVPLTELPLVREVLDQGQSLAVSDLQAGPLAPPVREFMAARGVDSIMLVPLMVRATTIGFMSVAADQAGRTFTPEELGLAETIAADIAVAVENARLLERTKAAAAAEERNRIARELHDSVTQTMYSVSIVAEALPRLLERDLAEAKRNAAYLRQTTLGALAEMRTLLFELRPGTLEKAGLDVLLQQLADVLTGRTRVPVEVTVQGEAEVPIDAKIGLYRIAQEAFNNIGKHARADRAWVTLQRGSAGTILTIRDNGRGFDPGSVPPEHMGVRIMRERAQEIGAALTIESRPGQGTTISVVWTNGEGRRTKDDRRTTKGTWDGGGRIGAV